MQSGAALIDEASTIEAMRARRGAPRRPLPTGMLGTLTVVFWAVWIYLILPLVSLVLWVSGVRLFAREIGADSYGGLAQTLIAYSSTLLVLVALLALWIAWNVARYGGTHDRRRVKADEIADRVVWERFRLDDALGQSLRQARSVRVDVDETGFVTGLHPLDRRSLSQPHGNGADSLDRPDVRLAGRRRGEAREADRQPRAQGIVDDSGHPVRARVGEVEEIVEVGRVLRQPERQVDH